MLRAGNYSIISDPDGHRVERDNFTCGHCGKIVFVKPGQRGEDVGGMCKLCYNLICGECVDLLVCEPLERKLERDEKRERFLRQAGLL